MLSMPQLDRFLKELPLCTTKSSPIAVAISTDLLKVAPAISLPGRVVIVELACVQHRGLPWNWGPMSFLELSCLTME